MARVALLISASLVASATAQSACCPAATPLSFDTPVQATVAPGQWTDFYFVAQNDGDSLAFELSAQSTAPTALGVYVLDGRVADSTTPEGASCRLCTNGAPSAPAAGGGQDITSVSSLHPTHAPASAMAIDTDTVSFIGNSTHRNYFVYVGECYHMVGSVYYLSVYGQTADTVTFTATVRRVQSALQIASATNEVVTSGAVCDGKYMHYYVDWGHVAAGGMVASVRKTGGELDAFYVRDERCAGAEATHVGAASTNLFGPINLGGFGLSEGRAVLPSAGHSLRAGRYYISIRGTVDLCGYFNVAVTNLTQHEFHAATHSS